MATPKTIEDLAKILRDENGRVFKQVNAAWLRSNKKRIPNKVRRIMSSGLSPVNNVVQYVDYSDSYKKAIKQGRYKKYRKRQKPVNLKLSGELHQSIEMATTPRGIQILSNDPKLEYHNDGTDNMPARQIFPNPGQTFKPEVMNILSDSLLKIMTNTLNKIIRRKSDAT